MTTTTVAERDTLPASIVSTTMGEVKMESTTEGGATDKGKLLDVKPTAVQSDDSAGKRKGGVEGEENAVEKRTKNTKYEVGTVVWKVCSAVAGGRRVLDTLSSLAQF